MKFMTYPREWNTPSETFRNEIKDLRGSFWLIFFSLFMLSYLLQAPTLRVMIIIVFMFIPFFGLYALVVFPYYLRGRGCIWCEIELPEDETHESTNEEKDSEVNEEIPSRVSLPSLIGTILDDNGIAYSRTTVKERAPEGTRLIGYSWSERFDLKGTKGNREGVEGESMEGVEGENMEGNVKGNNQGNAEDNKKENYEGLFIRVSRPILDRSHHIVETPTWIFIGPLKMGMESRVHEVGDMILPVLRKEEVRYFENHLKIESVFGGLLRAGRSYGRKALDRKMICFTTAMNIATHGEDREWAYKVLGSVGRLLWPDPAMREMAIVYFREALKIAREEDDWDKMGNCLMLMGMIHEDMHEPERARENLEEAIPFIEATGDEERIRLLEKTLEKVRGEEAQKVE